MTRELDHPADQQHCQLLVGCLSAIAPCFSVACYIVSERRADANHGPSGLAGVHPSLMLVGMMSAGAGLLRIRRLLGSLSANRNQHVFPLPASLWHCTVPWLVGFRLWHVKSVVLSVTFCCCIVYLVTFLFCYWEIRSALVVPKGVVLAVCVHLQERDLSYVTFILYFKF